MSLVLTGGLVWDGCSEEPAEADLVVDDGRIEAVAAPGTVRPGDDDVVLDLGGSIVLPGLIDMHVHLVWSGGPDPARTVEHAGEQITTLRAAANAQAQLLAGVTTVRDVGSNWDIAISLARTIDRGELEGPSIIASGRTVIMTGGHDPFWGVMADGVDAVVAAVRGQVAAGAGVIKTAATGGAYGREEGEEVGQAELSPAELGALTAEAHRFGRRVAAHALGTEGIANAVAAGVDTIEHGVFLTEELADRMAAAGTVLCPTVEIYRVIASGGGGEVPDYARAKAEAVVAAHEQSVRMALAAGVPVVAGTDAGSVLLPHPALASELLALRSCGMSATDVLRAATSGAAAALGRSGLGVIEPGARADLIMVDGDPFTDTELLHRPWGVVRGGRHVRGRDRLARPVVAHIR
jgi:imidazolonepropionase-like amidohydrolase